MEEYIKDRMRIVGFLSVVFGAVWSGIWIFWKKFVWHLVSCKCSDIEWFELLDPVVVATGWSLFITTLVWYFIYRRPKHSRPTIQNKLLSPEHVLLEKFTDWLSRVQEAIPKYEPDVSRKADQQQGEQQAYLQHIREIIHKSGAFINTVRPIANTPGIMTICAEARELTNRIRQNLFDPVNRELGTPQDGNTPAELVQRLNKNGKELAEQISKLEREASTQGPYAIGSASWLEDWAANLLEIVKEDMEYLQKLLDEDFEPNSASLNSHGSIAHFYYHRSFKPSLELLHSALEASDHPKTRTIGQFSRQLLLDICSYVVEPLQTQATDPKSVIDSAAKNLMKLIDNARVIKETCKITV